MILQQGNAIRVFHASSVIRSWRIAQVLLFLLLVSMGGGCSSKKQPKESAQDQTPSVNGDQMFRLAQSEFDNGDYKLASENCQKALDGGLEHYPPSDVLVLMGQSYRMLRKYEKAVAAYDQALKENPENVKAMIFRGVVFRLQNRFDLAQKSYEAALEIEPQNADLQVSLGVLAIFQKDYQRAGEHLKLATELDSANSRAFSNLALAYAHQGLFDQAESSLKRADLLGYAKTDVVQAQIERLRSKAIRTGPTIPQEKSTTNNPNSGK